MIEALHTIQAEPIGIEAQGLARAFLGIAPEAWARTTTEASSLPGLSARAPSGIAVFHAVQDKQDVACDDCWLSTREMARLKGLKVAKRRSDWRLGRWTAKKMLASCLGMDGGLESLARIEILPAADGAPEPWVDGRPVPYSISISHRDGTAVCAAATGHCALGCDLERVEPHSAAFVEDYFAPGEQKLMTRLSAASQPFYASLIWSAKESALKAIRMGLRANPRSVQVRLRPGVPIGGWRPLSVKLGDGHDLHGWWRRSAELLITLVANPTPEAPVLVEPAHTTVFRPI